MCLNDYVLKPLTGVRFPYEVVAVSVKLNCVHDCRSDESLWNILQSRQRLEIRSGLAIILYIVVFFPHFVLIHTISPSFHAGHGEAVIAVCFSPDGRQLASGSGDMTVRFWDVLTETPLHTCKAHTHWVLCIAWSPDSRKLASGCKNGQVSHYWVPEEVGHASSFMWHS